ncbi:MAG: hypothetical protein QXW80_02895 [Candidatus Micrarchaeia archaeon]
MIGKANLSTVTGIDTTTTYFFDKYGKKSNSTSLALLMSIFLIFVYIVLLFLFTKKILDLMSRVPPISFEMVNLVMVYAFVFTVSTFILLVIIAVILALSDWC